MTNQELARQIIDKVGRDNIIKAFNCMTRLRMEVRKVNVTKKDFTGMEGVKGVILSQSEVHLVLGPGKAGNVARELKALLAEEPAGEAAIAESSTAGHGSADGQAEGKKSPASPQDGSKDTPAPEDGNGQGRTSVTELAKKAKVGDGKALHQAIRAKNASQGKALLHKIAHLFIPLIPAFIACGLITGITSLAVKIDPSLAAQPFIQYLRVTGSVVFWVLNAFVGLYAAREFGGTPILGGVMAALLSAPGTGGDHPLRSSSDPRTWRRLRGHPGRRLHGLHRETGAQAGARDAGAVPDAPADGAHRGDGHPLRHPAGRRHPL